jgi:hypothetical protein
MSQPPRIALVGDRDDAIVAHRAIPRALDRARPVVPAFEWLHTSALTGDVTLREAARSHAAARR